MLSVSWLIAPSMYRILSCNGWYHQNAFRVMVDSTKHISHTFHVMVDSTKMFSVSWLIAPSTYSTKHQARIAYFRVMVDSTKILVDNTKHISHTFVLWLIAPKCFLLHTFRLKVVCRICLYFSRTLSTTNLTRQCGACLTVNTCTHALSHH